MNASASSGESFERKSIRGAMRMLAWVAGWTFTMVLIDKAALYGWLNSGWPVNVAIGVNAAIGVATIHVYMKYLSSMDELQRRINLEALAMAFGVTLVASFSYSLMVTWSLISIPKVSHMVLLMTGTYVAGVIYGNVRYR